MLNPRYIARVALSIAIGAVGGTLFYMASLPLPWMLGAMCAVAAAAVGGLPVASTKKIRSPLAAVLGVTLGSSFRPAMFEHVSEWLPVTGAMVAATLLMGGAGFLYMTRVARFDRPTAFFSGMPAGLYEMTSQGGLAGGDERRIAIIQAIRIFLVVLLVPVILNFFLHFGSTSGLSMRATNGRETIVDFLILIGCGLIGWLGGRRLGIPNAPLLGPMLLSAIAHTMGMTDAVPPYALVSFAQVILGVSVGGQFIGADRRLLTHSMLHGIVMTPLMLTIAAMIAWIASQFSNINYPVIFLSMSPGGTAEMSLVALAIHAEVAIVVLHQLMRIIIIHICAPPFFRQSMAKKAA